MAQVPATPKVQRLLRLTIARLRGAEAARALPGLAPSEEAALQLRSALSGHKAAPAQEVIFLIPLVGRHHVGDWGAVTARLSRTLGSLIRQSSGAWRAVICAQEAPELPDDTRISFLPFDDPTPGNDKWRKLARLTAQLDKISTAPAYVMSFDADDLLHPGAVAEMLERQAPGGYLVSEGYVRDVATGGVALAGPPTPRLPLRKPFWKLCGSCAALRHHPTLPASTAFLREMTQHEHRMFPYLASLAGLPLAPLNAPRVLYELNHGENFGARRGRVGFKTRFVERFRIDDARTLAEIERDFLLS